MRSDINFLKRPQVIFACFLRRELNVKTPFNAVEKWFELDKTIFKLKPDEFRTKILNLKIKQAVSTQQPYET